MKKLHPIIFHESLYLATDEFIYIIRDISLGRLNQKIIFSYKKCTTSSSCMALASIHLVKQFVEIRRDFFSWVPMASAL